MQPDELRRERNTLVAARYRKRRALAELQGIPTAPIPAAPLRMHIKDLMALGWGSPSIIAAARIDATPTGLLLIANGHSLRAERKFAPILKLPLTLACPDHIPDHMHVPSLGAARRIRALMALGWRHEDIMHMIGGRSSSHLAQHRHKTINAHDWRLVDAAYEALGGTPGPSESSRRRARNSGYVPPLAWNDIDNPNEDPKPTTGRETTRAHFDPTVVDRILEGHWRETATPAEKAEVVRQWSLAGGSLAELERRTGWNAHRYVTKEAS